MRITDEVDRCPGCGCLLVSWSRGHAPNCTAVPPPPKRSRDCPDCAERAVVTNIIDNDDVVNVVFTCVECASSWVETADRDRLPPERPAVTP